MPTLKTSAPRLYLWLGLIVTLCLVILGMNQLVSAIKERARGLQSWAWWQVEGIVMRCEYRFSAGGRRGSNSDWAAIYYRYVVDGKPYFSDRVTVANQRVFERPENFVRDHVAGQSVTVYYRPLHPNESILIPGPDKQNTVGIGIGALMIVGGILSFSSIAMSLYRTSASRRDQVEAT